MLLSRSMPRRSIRLYIVLKTSEFLAVTFLARSRCGVQRRPRYGTFDAERAGAVHPIIFIDRRAPLTPGRDITA